MITQKLSAALMPSVERGAIYAWRGVVSAATKILNLLFMDLLPVACLASVIWGVHLISIPAAWITGGLVGLVVMFFLAKQPK